jgi:hypothetical protein
MFGPTAMGQTAARRQTYDLLGWNGKGCGDKGRLQDREYCSASVIDQIVADGKPAIPVLISQITDARLVPNRVYAYNWPQSQVGELAYFVLGDLFLDDTWTKRTMPELFPVVPCNKPGWGCWADFRKLHDLASIQVKWSMFWRTNQDRIYWDAKARCFRLGDAKPAK